MPAFRDILLSRRNGGWVLEASFYKKTEQAVRCVKVQDAEAEVARYEAAKRIRAMEDQEKL